MSEIAAIRSELERLQHDIAGDAATQQQRHELESEVATLYHELQQAVGHLEAEKAQRQAAEQQLESIRQQRLDDASAVVRELETKRRELTDLRQEREQMKAWLDRGVTECRRVADEVQGLKDALGKEEAQCSALREEREALGANVDSLSAELQQMQAGLEVSHREREQVEARAAAATAAVHSEEKQRQEAVAECDRLASEVARLSQRARGLDDAEGALQDTCQGLSDLVADMEATDRAVSLCDLDAVPPRPAADAPLQRPPVQTMALDAQRLLQALRDATERLRVSVKRYVSGRQRAHNDMHAAHTAAVEELRREGDAAAVSHRAQAAALQQRVDDLEREIVLVADGVQRDVEHEAQDRLAVLDGLTHENRELGTKLEGLRGENAELRGEVQKMKLDWAKVAASRKRYHQLEAEMGVLRDHHAQLQQENRNLKVLLDARLAARDAPPPTLSEQRHSTLQRQAFEDWRRRMTAE